MIMEIEYHTNDWESRRSKLEVFLVVVEQNAMCIN